MNSGRACGAKKSNGDLIRRFRRVGTLPDHPKAHARFVAEHVRSRLLVVCQRIKGQQNAVVAVVHFLLSDNIGQRDRRCRLKLELLLQGVEVVARLDRGNIVLHNCFKQFSEFTA